MKTSDSEYLELMQRKADERTVGVEIVKAALAKAGIRMNVNACGCCESPWVKVEIDGKLVLDADECSFFMFEEELK